MRSKHSRCGLTLLELLIAGAVLVLLLLSLSQIFAASYRAYNVSEDVSESRQMRQAAIELVRYEVSLAGYRCADADAESRDFGDLIFDSDADAISVRYYEDRFVDGSCVLQDVEYYVDGNTLWRADDDGATSVVEGVTGFEVVAWLNRASSQFVDPARPPPSSLAGVKLRLAFLDGEDEVFTIGFRNVQ